MGQWRRVCQYARERLEESGEAAAVQQRHAAFFLRLAEEAEPKLESLDKRVWLARLDREHDNLHAVLAWSHEQGEEGMALRLAGALGPFWVLRGYWSEGWRCIEATLARIEEDIHARDRCDRAAYAKALLASVDVAQWSGHQALVRPRLEESVALFRELGDRRLLLKSLCLLGQCRSLSLLQESLILAREMGDSFRLYQTLYALGNTALTMGDLQMAHSYCSQSLEICRRVGDNEWLARPIARLGKRALLRGDYEAARSFYEESVLLRRQNSDPWLPWFLRDLGYIALGQRDYERAAAAFEEALILARERNNRNDIAWLLSDIGALARCLGDDETARSSCQQSQDVFRELLGQEWARTARSRE